ncbi:MAG: VCBS repeat-containing protein [Deltaproteobacteria bacterium]|nr:VCBS repeat-containing protein [Deltaproteobacteria bacterium]
MNTDEHRWESWTGRAVAGALGTLIAYGVGGCGGGGGTAAECSSSAECPGGVCVDHRCVAGDGGGDADVGGDADADGDDGGGGEADGEAEAGCESGVVCGDECCAGGERCAYGGCVIDLGPCTTNDDCRGDSYCDADGRCTPYGTPPEVLSDPDCERPIEIGSFEPQEQCRWEGTTAGGAFDSWSLVYGAPMVADFDLDDDPLVLAPSIVVATFATSSDGGILRLLDGRTCEEQLRLEDAADRLIYASNFAIGDLDGAPDGRPEIVAAALQARESAGGLIAFGYDAAAGTLVRRWYGRRCDLAGEPRHVPNEWLNNNGPSMHDLDDDGVPEILLDKFVYDAAGCLLNPGGSYANYLRLGLFAVAVDVDNDGAPELAAPDGVFAWDTAAQDWTIETYWAPPAAEAAEATLVGHVAVADFGEFPGAVGDAAGRAELVVAAAPAIDSGPTATGRVRVMTVGGDIVFGPFDLPAEAASVAGRGGPPTIADFDGDGRREFAVAGGSRYTVFDLDCDIPEETGPGCARAAGLPRGVLWSRPSQDRSSNVTGSSVFDFDADGTAEVVYGDECFARIYRGTDGEVLFSRSASSGTGYEFPVIADVDGDFNSEIVVALNSGVSCPATDPIFTLGRSIFESQNGVIVLRDVEDRWAASRPLWTQHAYAITNVNDDLTIPRTSDWLPNHADPAMNNFRMNAQGTLERRGAADLTVALAHVADLCDAVTGEVTLAANVCNRGTNPVPDGARVVFYDGDPDAGAGLACETLLPRLLDVGACTEVSCTWFVPAGTTPEDVTVVVDPDDAVFECRDGNNRGVIPAVYCGLL